MTARRGGRADGASSPAGPTDAAALTSSRSSLSRPLGPRILADRLVRLVDAGILARGTAAPGQRARYSLTEAGIQTVPILYALGNWGVNWRTGGSEQFEAGEALMEELRARHLATIEGAS